jgi:hypothetical protein
MYRKYTRIGWEADEMTESLRVSRSDSTRDKMAADAKGQRSTRWKNDQIWKYYASNYRNKVSHTLTNI